MEVLGRQNLIFGPFDQSLVEAVHPDEAENVGNLAAEFNEEFAFEAFHHAGRSK